MALIETRDGTKLFYRDWGQGDVVVFVASQAVPGDIWNYNVPPLVEGGLRCVTFDRRGHGRSDEPGHGYDIDTLADDLRAVLVGLDLRDVTLIGHSLGGAEVIRYLGKHHDDHRVRRAVLLAAFGKATAGLVPGARFKLYEGAAHGLFLTHAARVHNDILEFIQGT